jgi:hypothetical protein
LAFAREEVLIGRLAGRLQDSVFLEQEQMDLFGKEKVLLQRLSQIHTGASLATTVPPSLASSTGHRSLSDQAECGKVCRAAVDFCRVGSVAVRRSSKGKKKRSSSCEELLSWIVLGRGV